LDRDHFGDWESITGRKEPVKKSAKSKGELFDVKATEVGETFEFRDNDYIRSTTNLAFLATIRSTEKTALEGR